VGVHSPLHPVRNKQIYLLQAAGTGLISREFLGFPVLPSAGGQHSPGLLSCVPSALALELSLHLLALPHVTAQPASLIFSHVPAHAQDPGSLRPLPSPRNGLLL